ncbi:hypothetical protein WAI453_003587 [Rhynchosporium graminicola]
MVTSSDDLIAGFPDASRSFFGPIRTTPLHQLLEEASSDRFSLFFAWSCLLFDMRWAAQLEIDSNQRHQGHLGK